MSQNSFSSILQTSIRIIHKIEDGILVFVLLAMLLLASSQIFLRNLFEAGLVWTDPLLRIMVLWIGLLGALAASRDNKHITIDLLTRIMSQKLQEQTRVLTHLITIFITATIAYHSARFIISEYEAKTIALAGIHTWVFESIIPVAFFLISVRYVIHLAEQIRKLIGKTPAP